MRHMLTRLSMIMLGGLFSLSAMAQVDVFRLESKTATPGEPVELRLYVQDVVGTALDNGDNPLTGFFNFNMKLTFDSALVDSVEFLKAGVTESSSPFFFLDNSDPDTGLAQVICSYTPDRMPVNLGASFPGDVVAVLRITPSAGAAGQTIQFNFDDTDTNLAGRGGFPVLRVSLGNLDLQLGDITVTGTPVLPTIDSFTASPGTIDQGNNSTLAWTVTGADTVSINQGIGSVAASGNRSVSPATTTTYTLTASNGSGSVTAQQTVTVNTPPPPVISSFTASPSTILQGDDTTLSWSVSGADSVSINQGVGTVAASGSTQVSPNATLTYTLTATNAAGSTTAQQTVTVNPLPMPSIADFSASPQTINPGGNSTLSWIVNGADTVSIDQGVGNVVTSGNTGVSPADTTTYTLTATNAAGSVQATATVAVVPPELPTIGNFSAAPQTITQGESASLSWSVSNADSVTINQSIGAVGNSGSQSVSPNATTTYTLTASNGSGSVDASVTIAVTQLPPPTINSFQVSPTQIGTGGQATLSWNVDDADTVTIDSGVGNVAAFGSLNVSPNATTTYTLTATNAAGTETAQATLTVSNQNPPSIDSFTVSPSTIVTGNAATLSWSVGNADQVSISTLGTVGSTGSRQVTPTETITYNIVAENGAGTVEDSVTLTVSDAPVPIINDFSVSPASIVSGETATLSWNVSNADTVDIGGGVGRVSSSGSRQVSPTETTRYDLLAGNSAGTANASVTLSVQPAVTIDSFNASQTQIIAGESVELSWVTQNATAVRLNGLAVNSSGSQTVTPDEDTMYTLVAEGQGGQSVSADLSIGVDEPALLLNNSLVILADNDDDASIVLSTNSSAPVSWRLSDVPGWLMVSETSGTVANNDPQPLSLTVDRDWFFPGREVSVRLEFTASGFAAAAVVLQASRSLRADETYLYYPLIWGDARYATGFNIVNLDDQTVLARLQLFNADGTLAAPIETGSVSPLANRAWQVDDLDQQVGWAVVTARATGAAPTAPPIAGAANIRAHDGEELFTVSAVDVRNDFLYVPHIAADTANFFTMSSVINLNNEFRGLDLATGNLPDYPIASTPPGGQNLFEYQEIMGGTISGPGWGTLQYAPMDSQDVVGAEVFGLTPATGARQTVGVGLNQAAGPELFVPHIAADTQNFWTGVVVINLDDQAATVSFEPYNAVGELIGGGFQESFAPGEKRSFLVLGDHLDFGPDAAWVRVTSSGPLTGYLLFGNPPSAGADQFAGFESVRQLSTRMLFPHTENTLVGGFTGISIINPGDTTANLTLRLVAADGTVKSVNDSLTLAPKTKLVGLVGNLFESSVALGDIVLVESSENLAGFQLYGAGSKTLGALAAWPY